MKSFAAVLMAGGHSRRMGTSKALLDYHGMPLWHFQIQKLLRLGPRQLFLSVRKNVELAPGPWTFVHDRLPDAGPLAGLDAALRHTCEDFLVVLAVDMPAMTSEFLSSLLREAGPAGIVPRLAGLYHGTAAVYPVEILPLVETILAGNDRSFQRLIRDALHCGLMRYGIFRPPQPAFSKTGIRRKTRNFQRRRAKTNNPSRTALTTKLYLRQLNQTAIAT